EGLEHRDLAVREHPRLGTVYVHTSDWAAIAEHRHRDDAEITDRLGLPLHAIFRILADILDVHDRAGQNGAADRTAVGRWHWPRLTDCLEPFGSDAVAGCVLNELAIEREDRSRSPSAQFPRARRNRLKHRLHIALRLADHPQDFAGGGLLLQCFSQ